MIMGAHLLLYSDDPEADREFFRDVLGFPYVDVGGGWLIFGLPPSEMAVHPSTGEKKQTHAGHAMQSAVLYLMCEDLKLLMDTLKIKGVRCTEVEEESWGIRTTIMLPSGAEIGLYQPTHETALGLSSVRQAIPERGRPE
jgi:catechol 2,3-dioxygenase-like lactoylglutathione lyase family enzyme